MIAEFDLTVSYTQIVVFISGTTPPEFDWTDQHVAQGFAWMPTIISFGVPDHDGQCLMQVDVVPQIEIEPETLWAIRVPFDVPSTPLTIGSIFDGKDVKIPEGKYSLIFEALPGDYIEGQKYAYVLRLNFVPDLNSDYEILKKGDGISTDTVLRRGA